MGAQDQASGRKGLRVERSAVRAVRAGVVWGLGETAEWDDGRHTVDKERVLGAANQIYGSYSGNPVNDREMTVNDRE